MKTKICKKCGVILTIDNLRTGHKERICRSCHNITRKEYRHKMVIDEDRERRTRKWASASLTAHRKNGYIISITLNELYEYALLVNKCEYTGIVLNWFSRVCSPTSPTIDRIDNGNESRLDNIRIVSHRINVMKQDLSFTDYINHCKYMVERYGCEI
jgi:hypothetical protein